MISAHPPDAFPGISRQSSSPQSGASLEVTALLGRLDLPTDGVRDYCKYLSQAFARRGDRMDVIELRWENNGWLKTLRSLWKQSRAWKHRRILFQYTALMWSRRGFPIRALAVLAILKWRRVRLGVVFHDAGYAPARGWIRRIRVACQIFTIRAAFRRAEFPVLTVPATQISWLPRDSRRAVFIPVGANFPADGAVDMRASLPSTPTVAVFGVTEGPHIAPEARDIAYAMKHAAAKVPHLHLMVLGRGALEAESALRKELAGTDIALSVSGVLPAEEVRARLAEADVLLFVRGAISSRRGSAIAGIVCGLPVVGYRGGDTAPPITEAGVLLVDDRDALAEALTRVLTDGQLCQELRQRNVSATAKHFSWDAIAAQFARALANSSA
ncbi:MAG: glycosyltransferase family 4 protein [Candidatus Acidiferrales bacterium]